MVVHVIERISNEHSLHKNEQDNISTRFYSVINSTDITYVHTIAKRALQVSLGQTFISFGPTISKVHVGLWYFNISQTYN